MPIKYTCPNHGNLEDLELQNPLDVVVHVTPQRKVIAKLHQ
jgi:hypothetical protein